MSCYRQPLGLVTGSIIARLALTIYRGNSVMAQKIFKILLFMKRRPGMTLEAFQDYYENHHAPLCVKYASGMKRYQRRYLTPQRNPETGAIEELPFDVITELWYDDEKVFRGTVKYLTTSTLPDEVIADEKQLFDRPKLRMTTVVEFESDLAK
jgi:hypothetical protein